MNIIIVSCSRILKIISAPTKVSEYKKCFAFLGNVGFWEADQQDDGLDCLSGTSNRKDSVELTHYMVKIHAALTNVSIKIKRDNFIHVRMNKMHGWLQVYTEISHDPLLFSTAQGIFWLSTERLSRSTLHLKEGEEGSLYSCTLYSLATSTPLCG